jgi:hypothetical protein
MYILAAQRDRDVTRAFSTYHDYLAREGARLPSTVLDIARSDWYFDPQDHRSPHDARLQRLTIAEAGPTPFAGSVPGIVVDLLGAHGDMALRFEYLGVLRYAIAAEELGRGHCDWRYDELRAGPAGEVVHEIEWSGRTHTARWIIESRDLRFSAKPLEADGK